MCVATNTCLHLVGKLGFLLNSSRLKRAGLDYWEHLHPQIFPDLSLYLEQLPPSSFSIYSTKGKKSYLEKKYLPDEILIFGSEDRGFPASFLSKHPEKIYCIPMQNQLVRSLNLSSSVAVVLFEALRQSQKPEI